ncbi:NAD(P)H-quinone oxidoreductase [Demequina sediminicola]|uniref:NAD(P)H-quinone oxidoreductase n=1 Tax=Demequina sediminicola TaxID=1095026 RepID=UPI000AFA978B|nr:NAD(P)H-quinone oxidoreductase [Demequina sediminicola]
MIISTPTVGTQKPSLIVDNAPDPAVADHDILISVEGAGINRADLLQVAGHYPSPPGTPSWPGLEVSGTVVEVGSNVSRHRPGDRVMALLAGGGYAERASVHEDLALPVPEGLTMSEAAGFMEAACTVWSNFDAADAVAGQTLVVHGGSGGVGSFAIQWAHAMGMRVLATAGGPERAARCEALGADAAWDYRDGNFSEAVRDLGGADVILDVVGAAYLADNLAALRTEGTLVVIGMQKGSRAELDLGVLLTKRARIVGTTLRARPHEQKAAIVAGVARDIIPLVPDAVRPVIHGSYPLAEAQAAHDALRAGGVFGKLILSPS